MIDVCAAHNVALKIVPARATPIAQPMDIGVFANVERAAQSLWEATKEQHPLIDVTPVESVKHLSTAWHNCSKETIIHGWNELWNLAPIPRSPAPPPSSSSSSAVIDESKTIGIYTDGISTRAKDYPRAITTAELTY